MIISELVDALQVFNEINYLVVHSSAIGKSGQVQRASRHTTINYLKRAKAHTPIFCMVMDEFGLTQFQIPILQMIPNETSK